MIEQIHSVGILFSLLGYYYITILEQKWTLSPSYIYIIELEYPKNLWGQLNIVIY